MCGGVRLPKSVNVCGQRPGCDTLAWGMDVTHPADKATPFPPALARLMFREGGGVQRLRLVFPRTAS